MTPKVRIIDRPAFTIAGRQAYISGPDNDQFGRFWEHCRAEGLLDVFRDIQRSSGIFPGPQTGGAVLGVSRVEKDPTNRSFNYMIAIEAPESNLPEGLEVCQVPAARWAVFECRGQVPDAIVAAEMFAFMEWLPNSGYHHALAPEMEVYPASNDKEYCEFWLPVSSAEPGR